MKVLARAKMPKTSQRDFLVAHRYTICDGMCALRGVLQTAVACEGSQKGTLRFPFGAEGAPTHLHTLRSVKLQRAELHCSQSQPIPHNPQYRSATAYAGE